MSRPNTIALDPAYVKPWTGDVAPPPDDALPARRCKCGEEAILDTDFDGFTICCRCGSLPPEDAE